MQGWVNALVHKGTKTHLNVIALVEDRNYRSIQRSVFPSHRTKICEEIFTLCLNQRNGGYVLEGNGCTRGMVGGRLRLSGIGEGISVNISTRVSGADSSEKVRQALQHLFPEAVDEVPMQEPEFGKGTDASWEFHNPPMTTFLGALHDQRILDTALDAMSKNLRDDATTFELSRQAAFAGKVAFPIPGDSPLGGVFRIKLEGDGLAQWIEAATWHPGRTQVPRTINDERTMDDDGEASTWH